MKIGLLIIASEILDGKINDLNARYLADFLLKRNLELTKALIIRDSENSIDEALELLFNECDLIVTSGGLGPTKDDLTKAALAKHLGRKILYSDLAESVAADNYKRFGREFPGKEHVYCSLPEGFIPLSNSTGMAPGLFAEHQSKHIISGPGVPREFQSLLEDHLSPWIEKNCHKDIFMENVVARTRKVPEEKIFGEVDKTLWDKLSVYGDVSSLPVMLGVNIGVKIKAKSRNALEQKKKSVMDIFNSSPVKSCIWHFGPESLEEIIVGLAASKGLTFGFAESATGGLCSHRITGVPGSSKSFMGSIISYDTEIKTSQLKVDQKIITEFGVVSAETAKAMALGLVQTLGIDIGISITGIAGPGGGTKELPVGTVYIGTHYKGITEVFTHKLAGDRQQLKERFSQAALMALLDQVAK